MNILEKVKLNELSPKRAYKLLYPRKRNERRGRRAHFVKIKIRLLDEPKVNWIMKTLFALPVPVGLARKMIARHAKEEDEIDYSHFLSYKNVVIDVITDEAIIKIKTI